MWSHVRADRRLICEHLMMQPELCWKPGQGIFHYIFLASVQRA
jgi:hypothetical protein